VVVARC